MFRRRFCTLTLASLAACRAGRHQSTSAKPNNPTPVPRSPTPADVMVHGGTVLTLDVDRPKTTAVAIADGIIVALGPQAEERALRGPRTQVIDLRGGTATPGLVDAHAHLAGLGRALEEVDLRGAKSIDEVVTRLRESAPPSGWITGRGWDQNLWPDKAMPRHGPLTQAFPDRPVWLRRVDGHAGWGNRRLLEDAGIGRDAPTREGGEIVRDAEGNPTGVLIDAAMGLVYPPAPTARDIERQLLAAQDHIRRRGLTGVHDMGVGPLEDEVYRTLASRGADGGLAIRVHAYASQPWFERDLSERAPDPILSDGQYALAGVKLYADGALGSRGAALLAPYADRPEHRGLMQQAPEALAATVAQALRGGWQVATHAIGDAANRAVLDAYEAGLSEAVAKDPRPRIEHAQIVHPDDIDRFAELGVIASMQPTHATSDMPWAEDRLGPQRLAGAYAWQRFLDAGVHVCFGSDFPVELADVTHGLYAAVTRQDAEGKPPGGWLPDQRVSLLQALASFSAEAAYAAHREQHLGRLAPGQRGDLSLFAEPLLDLPPTRLRETAILGTVIDGHPHLNN